MSSYMPAGPPRPTDSELEILTILWSRGPATVREINEIASRRKPAQYTTTLKIMQIMAEKGLVRRNSDQRAHVYEAACSRESTQKQLAGDLLERGFNGSAARLLQGALSAKRTSKAELVELRKLLDDYEKRTR